MTLCQNILKKFKTASNFVYMSCLSFFIVGSLSIGFSTLAVAQSQKDTIVYPIRGNLPDLKFSLNAGHNRTITQDNLKGKIVLVFFGYTYCPDICPTTMIELSLLRKKLPDNVRNLTQILFISVDPFRDNPDHLDLYVTTFDKDAIGVTGSDEQIAEIARRYRVSYQISKPKRPDDPYIVNHAQGIYIFDQQGQAQFLASNSNNIDLLEKTIIGMVK